MNPKTEVTASAANVEKKSEFSPMFLRWMISLTIVTLLLVFLGDYIFPRQSLRFDPIPWTQAGGIVIQQGLDLFSALQPAPISMGDKMGMLIGLLTAFVLSPTILFFSWRSLATGPKQSGLRPARIGFVVGVVLMTISSFGTFAVAIIHPQVATSMREAQALGESRDQIIGGMWRVSVDGYQYRILPKSLNGGSGLYKGYEVPPSLRKMEGDEYTAVSVSDTSFTILGSSSQYPGAGVQGVYDRQGKLSGSFKFMGSFQ